MVGGWQANGHATLKERGEGRKEEMDEAWSLGARLFSFQATTYNKQIMASATAAATATATASVSAGATRDAATFVPSLHTLGRIR